MTIVCLREFTIDPILAEALCGAIARNKGSMYVFPASRGGVRKRQMSMNDIWLRQLCARCKPPIVGSHVHVHALRRTVISMLLEQAFLLSLCLCKSLTMMLVTALSLCPVGSGIILPR